MADLETRVKELEQKQRERDQRAQKSVLGSRDAPLTTVFLRDSRTGAVAQVDYDSSTGALRVTKVR